MNAQEAYNVSKENVAIAAEEMLTKTIKTMSQKITEEAKRGKFTAAISINKKPGWFEFNNDERLIRHFEKRGFKVDVSTIVFETRVFCSWENPKY